MFKTITNNWNNMKLFLIPTVGLLILLTAFGCNDFNTVVAPQDQDVLAAPPGDDNYFYTDRVITEYGGQLIGGRAAQGTKLYILKGALTQKTTISLEAWSDGVSRINFRFGPHGTHFAIPAKLELGWAVLKNVTAEDLILYYYDDSLGEWVEETTAVWDDKKATIYLNHFSEYYFQRR